MEAVSFFFELQNTLKLFHWQTSSYARHIASDALVARLLLLSDQFMETYQGRYEKLRGGSCNIQVKSKSESSIIDYLEECCKWLQQMEKHLDLSKNDTDLLNIRDEMMGEINKTLYLFTFK